MSKYLPATLGIAAMLLASTASATARSALESASVKAATDCVAAAALNNPEIATLYRENRLREVTNWVVLRSSACDNPLSAMRLLHDRIYGQGTGLTFLRGDYLDDLPRAVGERIKVEILRQTVQKSDKIRGSSATVTGGVAPAPQPISKGTQLRVVQVRANDVLNMREEATNESPVVEFIPPNGEGIISLGETQGQWIFVQYDRAKGWVERQFVIPLASRGGRIQ
jgi:hypothetical protein